MEKKRVGDKDIVVTETPVVGSLIVNLGGKAESYFLVESRITTVDSYGVKFMVVPEVGYFFTNDHTVVYEFARAIVVSNSTPWVLEYGTTPERILVEEYEIES